MKLQLSIDDFHRKAATYMPTDLLSSIDVNEQRVEEEWEDAQYDSEEDDILPTMPYTNTPSTIGSYNQASATYSKIPQPHSPASGFSPPLANTPAVVTGTGAATSYTEAYPRRI